MTDRFNGKVALVTAAAAGIGAATARAFAEGGARVMLSDIDVDGGEALAEELRSAGRQADFIRADVTSEQEVRSEEHTSELQSLMRISYAVFCLNKKKKSTIR